MSRSTSKPAALPVAMSLFGIGLLAVIVVFGLSAVGYHNLPVWLNLAAMLAPLGLIVGVVAMIVQARRTSRT